MLIFYSFKKLLGDRCVIF